MSALPAPTLGPEEALAAVDPARREFAIALATGKVPMQDLAAANSLSLASAYRWAKDSAIAAYVDAVGRDTGMRAKRQLRGEIDKALAAIVRLMSDPEAPHAVQLKAATEILDRAGVTKEEITRSGQGGGDTVVQVNLSIPINPDAFNEQQERQRRKRAANAVIEGSYTEADGTD